MATAESVTERDSLIQSGFYGVFKSESGGMTFVNDVGLSFECDGISKGRRCQSQSDYKSRRLALAYGIGSGAG